MNRKIVFTGAVLIIGVIIIIRLFYLQVIDDKYRNKAFSLTEKEIVVMPARGLIYDRKKRLVVVNKPVYDLLVVPNEINNLDTLAFCQLVGVTLKEFKIKIQAAKKYSYRKESHFLKKLTQAEYIRISEQLFKFEGFVGRPNTVRSYPSKSGALLFGDVAEVSSRDLSNDSYYRQGEDIGKGGIEKRYEKALRGKKGLRYMFRNNFGVLQNSPGKNSDSIAVKGTEIIACVDIELQAYGEQLMQGKKGCIVAIDPSTGGILSMVSAPSFDPNLLVGKKRGYNYKPLSQDSLKPLFNRPVQAQYRPGSIFKMVQALVALQHGYIVPETRITCNRGIIGCHGSHTRDDLHDAIKHSCNPYFREVLKRMVEDKKISNGSRFEMAQVGLGNWKTNIEKFGFGSKLNTDIPRVQKGHIPGPRYYDKIYGDLAWAFSTIYSISIGEGELLVTPLQMANLAAIIANKGWYISPHTVSQVGDKKMYLGLEYRTPVGVNAEHFEVVRNAMEDVVNQDGGTARGGRVPGVVVCGKTGTVQNPPPLKDHSIFIAFAPKDNPTIAIAVYVENAGFGGAWAAPIASLMIEKYVKGEVTMTAKEKRILEADLINE